MFSSLLLILHIFATFFMTGVIWIVQFVHYPSFSFISEDKFNSFNNFHQASITYVVMPAMLLEIITGGLLILNPPFSKDLVLLLFGLIILTWLSTFFLSVPLHSQLLNGYSKEVINKLVLTNWPRTLIWSLRSSLLIYVLISLKSA